MPKVAVKPEGLSTSGGDWMWRQTEEVARTLNGIRVQAAGFRYHHLRLESAMHDMHKSVRRARKALSKYAKVAFDRSTPGYAQAFPSEAEKWDEVQSAQLALWTKAIMGAHDFAAELVIEYAKAMKEETGS